MLRFLRILALILPASLFQACQAGDGIEEKKDDEGIFSVIAEGPKTSWRLGDQISVNGNSSYYAYRLDKDGAWFSSSDKVPPSEGSEAFYPYYIAGQKKGAASLPGEQEYSPDGLKRVPLRAVSSGNTFTFKMLTGVLELKLRTESSSVHISRLTLRSERALSGNFSVRQDGSAAVTSTVGALSMEPDVVLGTEAESFCFCVPTGSFQKAELLVEAENGSVVSCPLEQISITRAETNVTSVVLDAADFVPSNTIYYTSSDGEKISPYGMEPVSNTYENGTGTMVFASPLATLVSHAFDNTSGYCPDAARLTSVSLPPTVRTMGPYVFQNCSLLKSIRIPSNEAFTTIPANMLTGCTSITELFIPDNVGKINNNAFQNCSALRSVRLPESIAAIPQNTFNGCSSLEEINIPAALSTIGVKAFMGTSIKSVTIPQAVAALPSQTFQNCSSLQEVTILRDATEGITTLGAANVFSGCSALAHIYVPSSSLEQYKTAQYWSAHSSIITAK